MWARVSWFAAACWGTVVSLAQPPIASRAGLIYYAEGEIRLNDHEVERFMPMVRVSAGDRLKVSDGKTEMLLQPRNFLRLASSSEVEMLADALSDVQLKVRGTAILDLGIVNARTRVRASCGDVVIDILQPGTYRLDCERDHQPDSLAVMRGRATLDGFRRQVEVTTHQFVLLNREMKPTALRGRRSDSFDDWSAARAALILSKQVKGRTLTPPNGVTVQPADSPRPLEQF